MAPGGDDIEELTEFKRMVVAMIKQLRQQRGEWNKKADPRYENSLDFLKQFKWEKMLEMKDSVNQLTTSVESLCNKMNCV